MYKILIIFQDKYDRNKYQNKNYNSDRKYRNDYHNNHENYSRGKYNYQNKFGDKPKPYYKPRKPEISNSHCIIII